MSDEINTPNALDGLVALQAAANAEGEKVRALADEYGPRPWTDEQHAAWDAQWKVWREAAVVVYEAVCGSPLVSEMGRFELEMLVKKMAKNPTAAA
ncbi:hypothetical protein [Streptomyces abikoensis]